MDNYTRAYWISCRTSNLRCDGYSTQCRRVRAAFSFRLTKAIMSSNSIHLQEGLNRRYYQRDPTPALPSGVCDGHLQDMMSFEQENMCPCRTRPLALNSRSNFGAVSSSPLGNHICFRRTYHVFRSRLRLSPIRFLTPAS